jgi:hypothetical protein
MPVATKTQPSKSGSTVGHLLNLSIEELHDRWNKIELDMQGPGHRFSDAEKVVANLVGADISPTGRQKIFSRIGAVQRHLADFGSLTELREDESALVSEDKLEAEKIPELDRKIAELQAEKLTYSAPPRKRRSIIERRLRGLVGLQQYENLPEDVRERLANAERDLGEGLGRAKAAMDGRIGAIKAMLAFDEAEARIHSQTVGLERVFQDYFGGNGRPSGKTPNLDVGAWQAYCEELKTELAELEKQLPELTRRYESELADVNELKNYYVR